MMDSNLSGWPQWSREEVNRSFPSHANEARKRATEPSRKCEYALSRVVEKGEGRYEYEGNAIDYLL